MIYGFIALISKQNRRFSLVPQLEVCHAESNYFENAQNVYVI